MKNSYFNHFEGDKISLLLFPILFILCILISTNTFAQSKEFKHSIGQGYTALDAKGYQKVHEETYVIYAKKGEKKKLVLPQDGLTDVEVMRGYYRWYNYDDESLPLNGLEHSVTYLPLDKGEYLLKGTPPGKSYFTMGNNAVKIACDISQYADYNETSSSITEPTLSCRVIFDIRPAQEIADLVCATPDQPLEEYNILAPENSTIHIGPKYKWTGGVEECNYYYDFGDGVKFIDESVLLSSPIEQIIEYGGFNNKPLRKTISWSEHTTYWMNGNDLSGLNIFAVSNTDIIDSRLIKLYSSDAKFFQLNFGAVDIIETYENEGTKRNPKWVLEKKQIIPQTDGKQTVIARFNINVQPSSEIGPSKTESGLSGKSKDELAKKYDLKATQNFDNLGIVTTDQCYPNPLSPEMSTYGFVYTTGDAAANTMGNSGVAAKGEYMLLRYSDANLAYWLNPVEHIGGRDKGYFMYVDATENPGKVADLKINGDLCPGSSIFVSAWVADLANDYDVPNLNFIVTGIDAADNAHQLMTYTTGDVTGTRGTWKQIFFEVKLEEREYAEYRIQVYNNGRSASGNDFAFDDINIYVSKPFVYGIQGKNSCSDKNNMALLRVDYRKEYDPAKDSPQQKLYYKWLDGNDENGTPIDIDYIGKTTDNNGGVCGYIEVDRSIDKPTPFYKSLNEFINNADLTKPVQTFYTTEAMNDGDKVVDRTVLYIVHNNEKFQQYHHYTSLLIKDAPDFTKAECNSMSTFQVLPRVRLLVDDYLYDDPVLQDLCPGTNYKLSSRAYGFNMSNNRVDSILCYADWYNVSSTVDEKTFIDALKLFRAYYPDADALQPSKGSFTPQHHHVLDTLIKTNRLQLYKKEVLATVSNDGSSSIYLAIPVVGAADLTFDICDNPLRIVLRGELIMSFGSDYDQLPADCQGAPYVIRVSESELKTKLPDKLRVNFVQAGYTLPKDLELYSTNDPDSANLLLKSVFSISSTKADVQVGDSLLLNDIVDLSFMKEGYYYVYKCKGNDETCKVPSAQIAIFVVPSHVKWNVNTVNNTWYNDANWVNLSGADNVVGFIPNSNTKVIIPAPNDLSACPALPVNQNDFGSNADPKLKYQYGIELAACDQIYLQSGAMFANIHNLNANKIWVDMPFSTDKNIWNLISVPFTGAVSGDIYVPTSAEPEGEAFNWSVAQVDDRITNKIKQKFYNAKTDTVGVTKESVLITTPGWTQPSNALAMKYAPAQGVAVLNTTNQRFVRLPKDATKYNYFSEGIGMLPDELFPPEIIDRTGAGELIYKGGSFTAKIDCVNEANVFLVGNPFLCNLDVAKFLQANSDLEDRFYYKYEDDGTLKVDIFNGASTSKLRPMRAMFVVSKNPVKQLIVNFDESMMDYVELNGEPIDIPIYKKAKSNFNSNRISVEAKYNNSVSLLSFEQSPVYSYDYDHNEDIPLITLGPDMTPISLYTVASNRSLMYSKVDEFNMVPLLLKIEDKVYLDHFSLIFSGVDNLNDDVYVYDSKYNMYTQIYDDVLYEFETPPSDDFRYYITKPDFVPTSVDEQYQSSINIYSPNEGRAVVVSSSSIAGIKIYDITGRLVHINHNVNANTYDISLPHGVYIFNIVSNSDVYNSKVLIK